MERNYTLDGLRIAPDADEYTFSRFHEVCAEHPERDALIFLGTRFTYGRLREAIDRFATALHGLGVGVQDRVLLYLPNTPQWVVANFAIQRIGAAVVPVSPIYTAHELAHVVADADVRTVVCQDTNFGYVQEVGRHLPLEHVIVTGLTEMLPAWKRIAGRLLDQVPRGRVARGPTIHRFGALLRRFPASPPDVRIDPWRDLAGITYTGGTTGLPKGVPTNHMTEVGYVRDVVDHVLRPHMQPGRERILMALPLFHIMPKGFLVAAGLNLGNTTVLMPGAHVDAALDAVERHEIGWMLGVPALYRMILESDRVDRYRLDSLRACFCGGDVLPARVDARWRELTGTPIHQVYGSTEVGHVAYGRLDCEPEADVVGEPLPSYRCRVADPETLEPVPPGEVGELLVAADWNIRSYWNRPDETARAFVSLGDETYYRMGDFVTLTERGEIRFVERTADVIKYKGYRVSASEVEAALQDHPTVVAACVVGVRDDDVGERIKAIVVLKHDARGVSGSDLKRWCRNRLASYKVPRHIEFRDMLPKSKVGKLLRREIRAEERRKSGDTGASGNPRRRD